jgi:predicted dithiol-disulfide oxidoreductase (DUF899 family)
MGLPEVVSREEWLEARRNLLEQEKAHTRANDALNAERRRLPMVRIEKEYIFEGPEGKLTLKDLFGASSQLVIQHVMFGPDWEAPCPSCSGAIRLMTPALFRGLEGRNTTFVLSSRAPYDKIAKAMEEHGWEVPWYSSYGSDFNFDFDVSYDEAAETPLLYNYREEPWLRGDNAPSEMPGMSFFLRDQDGAAYHTYSSFARGVEYAAGPLYPILDLTALGRSEDWEEPKGRAETPLPADPTFGA